MTNHKPNHQRVNNQVYLNYSKNAYTLPILFLAPIQIYQAKILSFLGLTLYLIRNIIYYPYDMFTVFMFPNCVADFIW